MTDPVRPKLIEVALPLDVINEAARLENQPFTRGHPRSLHTWWARRPLTTARAILFAQLVDDPSARPDLYPTADLQDKARRELFGVIEDLCEWRKLTDDAVLGRANTAIMSSWTTAPTIVDPFAGGGRIPMAAQHLGLEVHASDLNPVAVMINRALCQLPWEWRGSEPVHPNADIRARWEGNEGLREDVLLYMKALSSKARDRIGSAYPNAVSDDGEVTVPIGWLWAREVACQNPACDARVPLIRSFQLSARKNREAWLVPEVIGSRVEFSIEAAPPALELSGTVNRRGATCLVCQQPIELKYIRAEGRAQRIGHRLLAVIGEGPGRRVYCSATPAQVQAAEVERPINVPTGDVPAKALGFRVHAYGMTEYAHLFSDRQLLALTVLAGLVEEVHDLVRLDAVAHGLDENRAKLYAETIATFLALGISRWVDLSNTLCTWNSTNESVRALFSRQAIPMAWDFVEANPLSSTVSLESIFERALDSYPSWAMSPATVVMADARTVDIKGVYCTDPPYYDNIGYADLSDVFYVWLRYALAFTDDSLFSTVLTPKSDELIATRFRHDGKQADADAYFEDGFTEVFNRISRQHDSGAPLVVYYAYKQSSSEDDGLASTGWSTLLEGLVQAGWSITGTWPLHTERPERVVGKGSNALASSIALACRLRSAHASVTDRNGFLRALREDLAGGDEMGEVSSGPIRTLQRANIAPVDLRQAAIGPGMRVFSQFSKVVESDGSAMRVHTALGLINQVLDEILDEQEQDFDAETRWAIHWFSQHFYDEGQYGTAEQLAVSMNVAVSSMVESGILEAGRGKARLLSRDELPDDWDPTTDRRVPVWEAAQHLVHRLEQDGETAAARLARKLGSKATAAQLLAYRLYTVCESGRPALAGPYNALVQSWPEIQRLASQMTDDAGRTAENVPIEGFEDG